MLGNVCTFPKSHNWKSLWQQVQWKKSAPWMNVGTFNWTRQVQVAKNLEETRGDRNYANHENSNISNSEDFSLILVNWRSRVKGRLGFKGPIDTRVQFQDTKEGHLQTQIRPSFILLNHRKIVPQIEREFIMFYTPITLITESTDKSNLKKINLVPRS